MITKKIDMKTIEEQTILILETDTQDSNENKSKKFDLFREWVVSLNKEQLKGVIIGCATFRLQSSNSRLFGKTKKEKQFAGFKVKISNIYRQFAKSVF